jgi:hypothetical protein
MAMTPPPRPPYITPRAAKSMGWPLRMAAMGMARPVASMGRE